MKENTKSSLLLKMPLPIRRLYLRMTRKPFDPIKEFLEEWEEHIYDADTIEEVLDRVRGNKDYINLASQVRMMDSSEKMEKLTKWIIFLTISMVILGIIQVYLIL